MKPLRLLFWSDLFYPSIGGVEVLGARLVRALKQRGHEILIVGGPFFPNRADPDWFEEIPIYRFPFQYAVHAHNPKMVAQIIRQLDDLKRTFRPNLVHLFFTLNGFLIHSKSAAHYPLPTILSLHGNLLKSHPPLHATYSQLMRQSDWVTACSHATLEELRAWVPEIQNKSSALVNAFEFPSESPTPLNFDTPRLLCLGRLVPQKGFDLALAAFARVRERFPQAHLILAGDGPDRASLVAQSALLELDSSVEFRGWVPPLRVPELLNKATLVLMPSRFEPFGLVALQAAQMARPIIATRVDGLPEVVVNGETGILLEPENVTALVNAIEFLLTHPEHAQELGHAARLRAQQCFPWDRFVDQFEELYSQLSF
ncbi:MAG TPA: glycosyltransferase family 4 protein [Anaerolineae bacterium]|nr:glycosyltransferase family 4 protein [Anaerolineae bacterium]